jgi:hypothetical protein
MGHESFDATLPLRRSYPFSSRTPYRLSVYMEPGRSATSDLETEHQRIFLLMCMRI